jgi:acetate kinase
MKILVLNSGSSSLKYQLVDMETKKALAEGICERIGIDGVSTYKVPAMGLKETKELPLENHEEAIKLVISLLTGEKGVIKSLDEIGSIGHRVVHGGEEFDKSVIVTDEIIEKLKHLSALAPLHNPANILGIEVCKGLMPTKKNVAVFDTAFHQTMPAKAFMYPLPYEDYKELQVRKYGFHGTSHKYVSQKAACLLNKEDSKVIVCHLGNGSSVSAVRDGKSVDTSMGLTPLQGLMMGTRCGDIDPAAVLYIMGKRDLTPGEMDARMNKKSGMLGISGKTSDFRDVKAAFEAGDERASLTIEMLTYRIRSYVSQYAAALEGVDAVCFTGGIGENADLVREKSLEGLAFMGIELDKERNTNFRSLADENGVVDISVPGSKVRVYVIPTNEELVIAQDTYSLTK